MSGIMRVPPATVTHTFHLTSKASERFKGIILVYAEINNYGFPDVFTALCNGNNLGDSAWIKSSNITDNQATMTIDETRSGDTVNYTVTFSAAALTNDKATFLPPPPV